MFKYLMYWPLFCSTKGAANYVLTIYEYYAHYEFYDF